MRVWSHYIQKIPYLGGVYKRKYFSWKRSYLNLMRDTGLRPGPNVVHWLATFRCNAKCVYCEASANEAVCPELSTEEIKAVINQLGEMNVGRFFVTGGEPLMRTDLFDVLSHAKARGMTIAMITNSLLSARHKTEISEAGFSSIWTSVDGLAETHDRNRGVPGSFDTALNAIRFYRESEIPSIVVNTLVHPGNLSELPLLLEELRDAGISRWRLAMALPVGRAMGGESSQWNLSSAQIEGIFDYVEELREEFDVELSEELGYLGCRDLSTRNTPFICPAGLNFCVIMPDGNVLPCQVVYDNAYSEGNVRERSFREIWEEGFKHFRDPSLRSVCASCSHKKACSGGCWGRLVAGGGCLRPVFDKETYGQEDLGELARLHAADHGKPT